MYRGGFRGLQWGLELHLHLEQVFSAPLAGALIRSGHACLPRLASSEGNSSGIGGRPAGRLWVKRRFISRQSHRLEETQRSQHSHIPNVLLLKHTAESLTPD